MAPTDTAVSERGEEDTEKRALKKELLGMYKDKVWMLEEKVRRMEKDVKVHCGELAKRMEI